MRSDAELKANWLAPATAMQLEKAFDKPGAWTLAVQFIDRDLNYSRPTLATINVALPWHANLAVMIPAGTGVAGLLGWAFIARLMYMRKRHETERLREQLLVVNETMQPAHVSLWLRSLQQHTGKSSRRLEQLDTMEEDS